MALDDVRLHTGASELTVLVATESQVRDHLTRVWSLSRSESVPSLAEVGLTGEQLATAREVLTTPQGLILITGPTVSGKTNTLYAALGEIQRPSATSSRSKTRSRSSCRASPRCRSTSGPG